MTRPASSGSSYEAPDLDGPIAEDLQRFVTERKQKLGFPDWLI